MAEVLLKDRRLVHSGYPVARTQTPANVALWRLASFARVGTTHSAKSVSIVRRQRDSLPRVEKDDQKTKSMNYDDYVEHHDSEDFSKVPQSQVFTCQRAYLRACALFNVRPYSFLSKAISTSIINIDHMTLGPRDLKALYLALVDNISVQKLNLSDNLVGPRGTEYLSQVLEDNVSITHLILSGCRIGNGIHSLASAIRKNGTIKYLDISDNEIGEGQSNAIARILEGSQSLVDFNLAGNRMCVRGGHVIAKALEDAFVTRLNLSWNHIRLGGGVAICKALQGNTILTSLDLSWNGLHVDGSKALAQLLLTNCTICELNISCNRIDKTCLKEIMRGLSNNQTLKTLRIGYNPVTNEGALMLLKMLQLASESNLSTLDFSNLAVDAKFVEVLRCVRLSRDLTCVYGHVISECMCVGQDDLKALVDEEPMMVLMEFMRLRNLRLIDLFSSLDKDGSGTLTMEELKLGLQKSNIPLSQKQLSHLVKKLDTDGNGEIDMAELMAGQKEHRRKLARLREKAKDLPFEQTVIGRLSAKLQDLMSARMKMRTKEGQELQSSNNNLSGSFWQTKV